MTELDLYKQIVQKQDELIMLWKAPRYNEVWSAALRMEKELASLRQQLEKSKETKLSLPLDVPTDEEIETESNKITYRNIPTFDTQRVAFRIAAKWAIKQIIERNQK